MGFAQILKLCFSCRLFICAQPQTFKSTTMSFQFTPLPVCSQYIPSVLQYIAPATFPSPSPCCLHPSNPRGVFDGLMLLSRPPSRVCLQREGGHCIYQALACLRDAPPGPVALNRGSEESAVGTNELGWRASHRR